MSLSSMSRIRLRALDSGSLEVGKGFHRLWSVVQQEPEMTHVPNLFEVKRRSVNTLDVSKPSERACQQILPLAWTLKPSQTPEPYPIKLERYRED